MLRRIGCSAVLACLLAGPARASDDVPGAPPQARLQAADRIESVNQRVWPKQGALAVAPLASLAVNDPLLWRGGGGLRLQWWPRSLLGFSLEGSAWGQAPTDSARVAQRELRARLRSTGSAWLFLASAEISAADGKLAFARRILPFEMYLRLGAGATSAQDSFSSSPAAALGGAVGMRWFASSRFALETTLVWRTAALLREVGGRQVAARDTVVAFEIATPWRLGGAP